MLPAIVVAPWLGADTYTWWQAYVLDVLSREVGSWTGGQVSAEGS